MKDDGREAAPPDTGRLPPAETGDDQAAGLCAACVHMRRVTSARGARFFLCRRSASDPAYPRYPTLPVRRCAGFET